MLTSYSVIALLCWLVLLVSFGVMYAPERTTSEVIREVR
jgi:hypothetical protein